MSRFSVSLPLVLLIALNLACGGPSLLDDTEAKALGELPPLLFSAALEVKVEGRPEMPAEAQESLAGAIEYALREDLEAINAFTAIATAGGGDESAGGPHHDIRIVATAVPAGDGEALPEWWRNPGRATLTGIVWIAAGIASWLIPDTTFEPRWHVRVEVQHEGDAAPVEASETLRTSQTELNFYQRSSWWQFLFQLVCPPPVVPINKARTEESLDDIAVKEVSIQAALFAKRRLPGWEVVGGRPFLFSRPGGTEYVLFSPDVLVKLLVNGRDLRDARPSLESAEAYLDETFGRLSRAEEEAMFQDLKGYLEALGGRTAAPVVPGAVETALRGKFPRVYRFSRKALDDLAPPGERAEHVAAALDLSRQTLHRWTLPRPKANDGD